MELTMKNNNDYVVIYRKWITKNGRRIYPKAGKTFRLVIRRDKYRA
jgi:hypothetical protein